MAKHYLLLTINVFLSLLVLGQTKTNILDSLTINGGIDAYYNYNVNKPISGNHTFMVSNNRHNEINVNLAYLQLNYTNQNVRLNFTPAFGTYMQYNYAPEPMAYQNILEANVGVQISKAKNIWLDAGVFSSPITDEGYFSKDQLAYTRSLASEFTPYYLCGAKLTVPINNKLKALLYVVNGWQQIKDVNKGKSFLAELQYAFNQSWNADYNFYIGNQENLDQPAYKNRMVHNFYINGKLGYQTDISFNGYIINQNINALKNANLYAANIKVRYNINQKHSTTLRAEYIENDNLNDFTSFSPITTFNISNASVGYNYRLNQNALIRIEGRTFLSNKNIFETKSNPIKNEKILSANLTVWF